MVGGQRHFDVGRHSELEPLREKTVALGDHLARVGTLLHFDLGFGKSFIILVDWIIHLVLREDHQFSTVASVVSITLVAELCAPAPEHHCLCC